jgi:hypothetical protein
VAEYCSECHWACRCIEFRAHDTGHAAIHLIEKLKRRETLTIDRYEIDLRDQLERGRAILAPGSSRIQSQPSHPFIMWAVA